MHKRIPHFLFIAPTALCLAFATAAAGPEPVLSNNWISEEGLAAPWEANDQRDQTKVLVQAGAHSPFGGEPGVVRLLDNNQTAGGPSIRADFAAPVTGSLRISFEFKLPEKTTNHPSMVLEDSQGEPGLFLTLDNNGFPSSIPGNNIINRSGIDEAQRITAPRFGEWYQAELLIWPPEVGRYTLTITQHGGEPDRVEGLPFRKKLTDFAAIRFLSNTGTGTGTWEIANVRVEKDIDIGLAGPLRKYEADALEEALTLTLHVDGHATENGDGSADRPFATLEAAQMKVREIKQGNDYPSGGITVEVAGGIYYREKTWQLTQADSGLWNAPVIYRAKADANVILHGGRSLRLSQFQPVRDRAILNRLPEAARASVVQLDLPTVGITDYGELPLLGHSMFALNQMTKWRSGQQEPELFFNSQPMTLARWPNEGFARVGRIVEKGDNVRMWLDDVKGRKDYVPEAERNNPPVGFAFQLKDADPERLERWSQENDLRLYGYWFNNFSDQTVEVAEVDPATGTLRSVQPSTYSIKSNQRFFAYNALSELDVPGEWYLDRETGILYLYPSQSVADARIDISLMTDPLVRMDGASFVRFEGLSFMATRSDGVIVRGGEGVALDHCRVGNVGKSGVQMFGSHHRFLNGEILQTGGSGITLSGGDTGLLAPSGNAVLNSHIHNFARIFKTYQPAVRLIGVGNRVAHCEINSAPHVAMLIGGNNHLIELNYIHDVARETDDMAAIYGGRSWTSRGTVIRHNLFYNITGYGQGTHKVSGVYLDDGFSGTNVVENIFINVAQGIFFNGGRNNRAENNLFINVDTMMRATDMTAAYKTWAIGSYGTLVKGLKASPYQTPVWQAHFPKLANILEDEPAKPKYSTIKDNLRFNTPIIFGPQGIHHDMRKVGWVTNNPEIQTRPGAVNPETHTFAPDPASGLFEAMPDLKRIPFSHMGRYE